MKILEGWIYEVVSVVPFPILNVLLALNKYYNTLLYQ